MEQNPFFLFNVIKGQNGELHMINKKSYFYEALDNQAKDIRKYAATKGLIIRSQKISQPDRDQTETQCNRNDQNNEKISTINTTTLVKPIPTSPKFGKSATNITETKRKISHNRSVQTDTTKIKEQNKPRKRQNRKHSKN